MLSYSTYKKTAVIIVIINAVLFAIFGVVYLLTPSLMPYHEAFLGKTSQELKDIDPEAFELMIIFMRVIGGAFLSYVFLSLYLLAIFHRKNQKELILGIIIAGFIIGLPLLSVTLQVGAPWQLVTIGIILNTFLLIEHFLTEKTQN